MGEARQTVRSCHNGDFWSKFSDLRGQEGRVLAGGESVYLIPVAVMPGHIQGVGANRAGGAQNGERFHWGVVSQRMPSYHAAKGASPEPKRVRTPRRGHEASDWLCWI